MKSLEEQLFDQDLQEACGGVSAPDIDRALAAIKQERASGPEMLLDGVEPKRRSWSGRLALVASAACVIVGIGLIAFSGEFSESTPKPSTSASVQEDDRDATVLAPDASIDRPVMVGAMLIDPKDDRLVSRFSGGISLWKAAPAIGSPGVFDLHGTLVDAATGKEYSALPPSITIAPTQKTGSFVVKYSKDDQVLWTRSFERVWQLDGKAWDDTHIYLSSGDSGIAKLIALDWTTGYTMWESEMAAGPAVIWKGMIVHKIWVDLGGSSEHFIVARDKYTGVELKRWKISGPTFPRSLFVEGDLLFAIGEAYPEKSMTPMPDYVSVIDQHAGIIYEGIHEQLHSIYPVNGSANPEFLLSGDTVTGRYNSEGEAIWEIDREKREKSKRFHQTFACRGPEDDLIVIEYHPIADSGVELRRLDSRDGHEKWKVKCEPLGVAHSRYYHSAYAESRGDNLVVVSQGAAGYFIETLDAETGTSISRWPDK